MDITLEPDNDTLIRVKWSDKYNVDHEELISLKFTPDILNKREMEIAIGAALPGMEWQWVSYK